MRPGKERLPAAIFRRARVRLGVSGRAALAWWANMILTAPRTASAAGDVRHVSAVDEGEAAPRSAGERSGASATVLTTPLTFAIQAVTAPAVAEQLNALLGAYL